MAGEASGEDELLVARQSLAAARQSQRGATGVARGPEPVSAPGREQDAGDVVGSGRPEAADVSAGRGEVARRGRAVRPAAREPGCCCARRMALVGSAASCGVCQRSQRVGHGCAAAREEAHEQLHQPGRRCARRHRLIVPSRPDRRAGRAAHSTPSDSTSLPVLSPEKSFNSASGKALTPPSTMCSREINRPSPSHPASAPVASPKRAA